MSGKTEYEYLIKECVQYFKQNNIWKRLFTGFRKKYISYGRFSGKITLRNISYDDIEELEGFFGKNYHGKKSVTIAAENFAEALSHSRYAGITPEEVLKEYFGEALLCREEENALRKQQLNCIEEKYMETFAGTPSVGLLKEFEMIIKSFCTDICEWEVWLGLCAKIYNMLPYRTDNKMYLAVFAAMVTGNPHSFDSGTKEGNCLYKLIQMNLQYRNMEVKDSELFPAYKRQKSYLLAGIMIDDISNYAMLYNVHAVKKDGSLHKGVEGFFREKNIIQVPLNVISGWSRIECIDNEIYIVENPAVFAMMCREKSCMCMNGQPRLAGLMVLELLAVSDIKVYYSGDLDPEGLLIAQKLSQFYAGEFIYFHMSVGDYEKCRSDEVLSDRRKKMLGKITDGRLLQVARSIEEYGVAGYQESLQPYLNSDIDT